MATLANITNPAPAPATAPKAATKAATKAAPTAGRLPAELEALFTRYRNESDAAKKARGEASALTRAAAITRAEILGLCLNPKAEWKTTATHCVSAFKALGKLSEYESAILRGARLV